MTTDPRSASSTTNPWIIDSRVYNLIWLGRWMERADSMLRAIDTAALLAVRTDGPTFQSGLQTVAEGFRVSVEGTDDLLDALLRQRSTSSVYASIERARDNANQVAPLELIQALNIVCATIDESKPSIEDPAGAHELISDHLTQMAAASGVVENLWFRKAPLSEEEVYRRFVQQ